MRISDWSSDVCSSDLLSGKAGNWTKTTPPCILREGWREPFDGGIQVPVNPWPGLWHAPPTRRRPVTIRTIASRRVLLADGSVEDTTVTVEDGRLAADGGGSRGVEWDVGNEWLLPGIVEIRRASCGERVCQYVSITVVVSALKIQKAEASRT